MHFTKNQLTPRKGKIDQQRQLKVTGIDPTIVVTQHMWLLINSSAYIV
jgi:hypothetical protein